MGCFEDKNGADQQRLFRKKVETWHIGLSCQYVHSISFSNKPAHDTIADLVTLRADNCMLLAHRP